MAGSITISAAQKNSITIDFGENMTAGVTATTDYVFTAAAGYRAVYAESVTAVTGTQVYKIKVFPEFDVPGTYTVTCAPARDAGGAALSTNNKTFAMTGHFVLAVPDGQINYVDSSTDAQSSGNYIGVLEALSLAFGESFQKTSGRPVTRLRRNYQLTDQAMLLETTLAFPATGYVYANGVKLKYSSKDTDVLYMDTTTISADLIAGKIGVQPGHTFATGSEVHLDVRSILPA